MGDEDELGSWLWSAVKYIVAMAVLWALLGGVTVRGVHYGITCGSNGVEVSP